MPKVNQNTAGLKTICAETYERRHGGSLAPRSRDRLDRELALVERLGRVQDYLAAAVVGRFADENDIPLRLAGAGGSSSVAFCLDLTQVYQVACGFAAAGHRAIAVDIADKTVANAITNGINEHYDSVTGKPLGVGNLGMSCSIITLMLDGLTSNYHLKVRKTA